MLTALFVDTGLPSRLHGQGLIVPNGDFDICDNEGTLVGNTARLRGRPGFGTERGTFVLVNANSVAQDCDRDGYTPGINFTDLIVSDTSNFVNVADPTKFILKTNLVIADFLNPLNNGAQNIVSFFVNIPDGTPAGFYRGNFTIRDRVRAPGVNINGEAIRVDGIFVEIEVLPRRNVGLVLPDTARRADSVVLRGRAGQTATGVVRVANLGNIELTNVRLEATDLVASSGTGLRIPQGSVTFSPQSLARVSSGDTTRVTISARIPAGLLAGSYRGDLIVQAQDVPAIRIPLTVIVFGAGDIVFDSNPVRGARGDNAVIIFNGDPGTIWEMRVFDMRGITTFAASNTVFAGTPAAGTVPGTPGDEAVRFTWPLLNGRGEAVAGGMYLVVVNAVQDGKTRQMRAKLMVIR